VVSPSPDIGVINGTVHTITETLGIGIGTPLLERSCEGQQDGCWPRLGWSCSRRSRGIQCPQRQSVGGDWVGARLSYHSNLECRARHIGRQQYARRVVKSWAIASTYPFMKGKQATYIAKVEDAGRVVLRMT
jgi:hypothetical protein